MWFTVFVYSMQAVTTVALQIFFTPPLSFCSRYCSPAVVNVTYCIHVAIYRLWRYYRLCGPSLFCSSVLHPSVHSASLKIPPPGSVCQTLAATGGCILVSTGGIMYIILYWMWSREWLSSCLKHQHSSPCILLCYNSLRQNWRPPRSCNPVIWRAVYWRRSEPQWWTCRDEKAFTAVKDIMYCVALSLKT